MAASISINNVKAILLLSHWFTLVFSLALLTTYSYGHATWSYLFLCSVAGIIGFLMTLAAWRKRSIGLLALVGSVMTMIYLQAQNFLATGTCAALVLQGVFLQAFLFFSFSRYSDDLSDLIVTWRCVKKTPNQTTLPTSYRFFIYAPWKQTVKSLYWLLGACS